MNTKTILTGAIVIVVLGGIAWFLFFSPGSSPQTTGNGGGLPSAEVNTTYSAGSNQAQGGTNGSAAASQQKIFKISDGPVVGATFIQTLRPTTTLARFVMANDGHAYELPLDIPGAVPRAISNTTIPGALFALWVEGGNGAILQYLDGLTVKTVYLGFFAASSSAPVRLQFYPDGVFSLAAAPDGGSVAYLSHTASGVDGFVSKPDGTGGKKLFSLPLSQMTLVWPAQGTLIAYSNPAFGVPGISFTVDAKSGVVTPLLSALGLSATADSAFAHVVYQTLDNSTPTTYSRDVKAGSALVLPFNPAPEQCVRSPLEAYVLFCAAPSSPVVASYLDRWHQGTASAPETLFVFNLAAGTALAVANPGSGDGGVPTDMASIAVSPDLHYALFISKTDRSLWGVRLTQ